MSCMFIILSYYSLILSGHLFFKPQQSVFCLIQCIDDAFNWDLFNLPCFLFPRFPFDFFQNLSLLDCSFISYIAFLISFSCFFIFDFVNHFYNHSFEFVTQYFIHFNILVISYCGIVFFCRSYIVFFIFLSLYIEVCVSGAKPPAGNSNLPYCLS
jgi:hypothetical protein